MSISTTPAAARFPAEPRPAVLACAHCGLDVPAGLRSTNGAPSFCCQGCHAAYEIIRGNGLDGYYRVRASADADAHPVRTTGRSFEEFDSDTFLSLYARGAGHDQRVRCADLFLENVHCAACVWLVEKLPTLVPGVIESRLDHRRATAQITWDHAATPLSTVARTLDLLGYTPHPARGASATNARRVEERRALVNLGVAGACAGNAMLLAVALYAGMFDRMDAEHAQLLRWASMGIGLVSLAWPGRVFFRSAWVAVRTGVMHLDLPITIGLIAGAISGVVNTVLGRGEIYFDSLSVLVFLLLLGRLIQRRQQRWAADSVELLFSLTPRTARAVTAGAAREVPIESVSPGDLLEVRAGESVPADGRVEDGRSTVDQSLLTGESTPIAVTGGAEVFAGSLNVQDRLLVRAHATGAATRVGAMMKLVEEGSRQRPPVVRLADTMAVSFVVGMLSLAAITAVVWAFIDPSRALDNAAALLIVTCPCVLGLATPMAFTIATGRAARRGILIKGADAIQHLATPGTLLLDKTGTLTQGRLELIAFTGPDYVRPVVTALESRSSHPIAKAWLRANPADAKTPTASHVTAESTGLVGEVGGRRFRIGSPAGIRAAGVEIPREFAAAEADLVRRAVTPVFIADDSRVIAAAGFADPVHPQSRATIDHLRRRGWEPQILSGDHPDVVRAVGASLGLDADASLGGLKPEDKLDVVRRGSKTPTVMIGDGVNDAAALAAADVGIAVSGGAEASLAAADIYLTKPGIGAIADLTDACRRTMGVVRRNLAVSLGYNLLAAGLSVAGVINPLIAAILMPVSSLTVLTLSVVSRTFEERPCR